MKTILFIAALAATFTIFSCKKDKKPAENHETEFSGSIDLSSPHEGDTVTGNFLVTGSITGNANMHGYHLGIYKAANEELVYENQSHEHEASYAISETVSHSLTDTTNLKVVVIAAVDHDGNTVTKTVNFVYKP